MILIIIENGDYTVYIHTNKVNGKRYVGITRQKPTQRWRDGKGYKRCTYFERAINKYGWYGFAHEIIADKLTEDEAKNMEKLLIKELKTQDPEFGYNISDGGDVTRLSEEGRRKQSEDKIGAKNPCFGKIYTEEERLRISQQTRGENNPNYKRSHTDYERKKMSDANLGKHLSDEHKKKLSDRFKGKSRSTPVVCIDTGEIFASVVDAARAKNMYSNRTNISKVCQGYGNIAGGYHWKYYESSVS